MGIAIATFALVLLLMLSYVAAWNHRVPYLCVFVAGAVAVAVSCDTALSPLFTESTLRGAERFLEVGPAFILCASILVGYAYAWKRKLFHLLVCLGLAFATICLGW